MITSTANERIKYVRSLHRVEVRRREKSFFAEGIRLVEEALQSGLRPNLVLVNNELLVKSPRGRRLLGRLGTFPTIPVSQSVLEYAADTITPQGVIAVLPYPELQEPYDLGPLVLVLDGLKDPGNVGTVMRSAEASGVRTVILTPDCVDAYNPKVVRAGMGAHFRLAVLPELDWRKIGPILEGREVWVAGADKGVAHFDVDWTRQTALVIGSEAFGPQRDADKLATGFTHIPMVGEAESLNAAVAASVILFEALRQRSNSADNLTG
jgi:TrmH family RNA methyltransferase